MTIRPLYVPHPLATVWNRLAKDTCREAEITRVVRWAFHNRMFQHTRLIGILPQPGPATQGRLTEFGRDLIGHSVQLQMTLTLELIKDLLLDQARGVEGFHVDVEDHGWICSLRCSKWSNSTACR